MTQQTLAHEDEVVSPYRDAFNLIAEAMDAAPKNEALHSALEHLMTYLTDTPLRVGQAADVLGVTENTVKNWIRLGRFPGARQTEGGHWRVSFREVLELREGQDRAQRLNAAGVLRQEQFVGDPFADQPDC